MPLDMLDFASFGVEAGSGTVLGFIAGYATKKIVKLVVVIIGLFILLLKFLESRGIIEGVNWDRLAELLGRTAEDATQEATGDASASLTESILSVLPFSGGFAVGFAIGMKRG